MPSAAQRPDRLIESALGRLAEQGRGWLASGAPVEVRVRVERTRPFSYLVWADLVGSARTLPVVVKIPRAPGDDWTRRLAQEYLMSRALAPRLAERGADIVATALAFFPDIPALVTAAVPGSDLRALIDRYGRWRANPAEIETLEGACHAAGRLLRTFQAVTARPAVRLDFDEVLAYIDVRLRALVELQAPRIDGEWRVGLLRALESWRHRLDPAELRVSGIHGDFCPSNVIYESDRAVLIDCSMFRAGSVFHDVTRFHHQLGLFCHKPTFRADVLERARRAFLRGYGEPGVVGSTLFRVFTVQHVLCHWVGCLRQTPTSLRERLYNRWLCTRHRREVEGLIA